MFYILYDFTAVHWCHCLKNEAVSNQMLPRWHCMVDQNELFCVQNSISFGKISNTTHYNLALNHDRHSTVLDGCRPSLIPLSSSVYTDKLNQTFPSFPSFMDQLKVQMQFSCRLSGSGFFFLFF